MNIDTWQKGYAELSRQLANLKKENLAMKDELIKLRRTYEDQIDNLTLDNMPTVKKIQTEQGKNIAAVEVKADEVKAEVNIATQTATEASNAVTLLSAQTNANGARITSLAEMQTEQGKSIAKVSQDTAENAASIKGLASVQTEQGNSIAGFEAKATELEAEIISIAEVQTEQGKSIAAIDAKADSAVSQISLAVQRSEEAEEAATQASAKVDLTADELGASIAQLTATQTAQGKSIAAITQTTNELGAEVNIAVESASAANENVSNGAYIVARVNDDESGIKIKADKVEIEGVVTFSDLEEEGKTTINGANLMTGTVVADRIAMNENGQIDFSNLGSLDFLTESGASGSIRLNENEYGRGEIGIRADMYVGISGGSASVILNETPNYETEMRVYANNFVMNGNHGVTGDFSLGNGSITVVNGIVVNVVEGGSGGGGGDEPTTLLDPEVIADEEYYYFSISNPNDVGTIHYYLFYHDNSTGSWRSDTESAEGSVTGYLEAPSNGGVAGVTAWVEYNGIESNTVTATVDVA